MELEPNQRPKILVFAVDGRITAEERAFIQEVQASGISVEVRDPAQIRKGDAMEPNHGIHLFDESLTVPEAYKDQPNAAEVIEKKRAEIERRRGVVGDAPPVKTDEKPASKPAAAPPKSGAPAWGKGK